MSPVRVILLMAAFVLLHEFHAVWALLESSGIAPELAYTAYDGLSEKDGTYALVADLSNLLCLLLCCLVLHNQARGALKIGVAFMSVYIATQAIWLVADPMRCDTLMAELATMGVAVWFTYLIGSLQRLSVTVPRIRTHP